MRKGKQGFTLIELMIVIAIIAIIAAIAIPGLLSSQRASNERNASTSLKTLSSAEADFRSNDRDWNHVNDFWTFNVCGLYTMTSGAITGSPSATNTLDGPIKLIELSVASADSLGTTASPATNDDIGLAAFAVSSPKAGYWYLALIQDLSLGNVDESSYVLDTGGTPAMGSCHNTSKFGFIAYPDSQSAGKYVFIVNENNTIFRSAITSSVRPSVNSPPGAQNNAQYANWPTDDTLKSYWSKLD